MNEVYNLVPQHLMREEKQAPAKSAMGKDDFMKLLMAQLQHQDPTKPMDHQAFGTQLAQFSQLEQLSNIGAGIQSLRTDKTDDSKLQALGMIGKSVRASGNEVNLTSGQNVEIHPSLSEGVQPVKVSIYDAGMKLVNEINLAGKTQGDTITWDGKSAEGNPLPSGKYSFRVHGVGRDGKGQEINTELSGRVTGVDVNGSAPMLMVQTAKGAVRLELSKVTQVTLEDSAQKTSLPVGQLGTPVKVASNIVGEGNASGRAGALPSQDDEESSPALMADGDGGTAESNPLESGQHSWSNFLPGLRSGVR